MRSLTLKLIGLLIVINFILIGCSFSKNTRIKPKNEFGYLIGSVTYDGMLSQYSMIYRNKVTGKTGFVYAGSAVMFGPKSDFNDRNGSVFCKKLPVGDYEFYKWTVGSSMILKTTIDFSIPFSIQEGISTYTGNFHFKQTANFGLVVSDAELTVEKQEDRDKKILGQKLDKQKRTGKITSLKTCDSLDSSKLNNPTPSHPNININS